MMRTHSTAEVLRRSAYIACLSALTLSGCDDEFTPLAPTQLQFSVYGYLDASADTQWIRVMPIRPLLVTSPDSFQATVTLEHLGSGRIIELRDSLFRFSSDLNPELGSGGVYLHNFWTTERIEAGASYRLRAQRPGGDPAEAIVRIPSEYDAEVWISQRDDRDDLLRLEGLKHLPFVAVRSHFYSPCGEHVDAVPFESQPSEGEVHITPIARPELPPWPCGDVVLEKRQVWAVASELPWPSGIVYSPSGLAVPAEASNISNAVGYIAGVLTRLVPYEACSYVGPRPASSTCILRYDATVATLTGTVRETRCGDGALDSVKVTLTEVDTEPPSDRKVRTAYTDRSGTFWMSALEPAKRYALQVRPKQVPDPFWGLIDIHSIPTDTLTFTPGQELLYDAEVVRYTLCE